MEQEKKRFDAQALTRFGILTALALVLGWLETLIPTGMAGVKLGLGNIAILYAVSLLGVTNAILLMLAKVLLSGILFGTMGSILYSLEGGILSVAAMLLLQRIPKISVILVSIGGSLFHNLGQALAACLFIPPETVFAYSPVLVVSGVVMGLLTGLIARYTLPSLKETGMNPKYEKPKDKYS